MNIGTIRLGIIIIFIGTLILIPINATTTKSTIIIDCYDKFGDVIIGQHCIDETRGEIEEFGIEVGYIILFTGILLSSIGLILEEEK